MDVHPWSIVGVVALCLICLQARAGTMLFDFETDGEAQVWHDEGGAGNQNFPVTRAEKFATSGTSSLCFRTPKWKEGMGEWPAAEGKPTITDWSPYERLVWDVTNPTPYHLQLVVFIADEGHATRDGLMYEKTLPPFSYLAAEVKMAELTAKGIDVGKIRVMHWFTTRPEGDLELYVDRMMFLKAGEARPEPPASYVKEFAALQGDSLGSMRKALADATQQVDAAGGRSPSAAKWGKARLAEYEADIDAFAEELKAASPKVLQVGEVRAKLDAGLAHVAAAVKLRVAFAGVQGRVAANSQSRQDVVVGFATSMEKVLPRGVTPTLRTESRVSIALARNEKEAFQVIVLPCEKPAKAVSVRIGDLKGPRGAVFAAKSIEAAVVGYVETKNVPPYGSPYVGWWPDPILSFMHETDIAAGDAQAFWVRLRAPKGQAAGTYRGKIEVLENGKALYSFDLSVQVYPFAMPDRSPLNMAVTWRPMFYRPDGKGGWAEGQYEDTSWEKHTIEWGDYLADHYLNYDSLYWGSPQDADFAVLEHLHKTGKLGTFNLGYYGVMPEQPDEQEKWKAEVRGRIGVAYAKAKALGILDHAYIYGADENPEAMFPGVERAAAFFKQEYPGAFVMTTTYDHTFGTGSVIKSMDAFCPLTPSFNIGIAEKAREEGKQVWWYICCGPGHPFANNFVEFPASDIRVLMGAQTARYRPDGFLYYQTSIWNGKPITKGPFTDYDPRSWTTYNGDGSWTCPGPDGTPLSTIRLENFRDGVEDYAYALLLDQAVKKVEASPDAAAKAAWLAKAKALLAVPDSVTKSMTEYTHDPADIYRWRTDMAAAIMASGVEVALEEK